MEFPHFQLYLRRLAAPVPWGAGLPVLLRSLRVRWWLTLAGWLLAVAVYLRIVHWLTTTHQFHSRMYLDMGLVFAASAALYFPLTIGMTGLTAESGVARHREDRGPAPAWYLGGISSLEAVLGTLGATLLSVLPAMIGLLLLLGGRALELETRAAARIGETLMQHLGTHARLPQFLWSCLGVLCRLPQLALATAALCCATRRAIPSLLVAGLVTSAATMAAFSNGDWIGSVWGNAVNLWPQEWPWMVLAAGCAAVSLGLTNWALRRLSTAETPGSLALAVLALCCGVPMLVSICGLVPLPLRNSNRPAEVLATTSHVFAAAYVPDFMPIELRGLIEGYPDPFAVDLRRVPETPTLFLYGRPVATSLGVALALLGYFASLAFWLITATQCLDAARGRRQSTTSSAAALGAERPAHQAG